MVRTALRNGAVFEIPYASALDGTAKRNWWATAREVVRVTKGKGVIVTGGSMDVADLRAPRDIGNLYVQFFGLMSSLTESIRVTFLGLAQNEAHDAATTTPKSLVLRARTCFLFVLSSSLASSLQLGGSSETRKTYRAVFSEPKVVIPGTSTVQPAWSSDSLETKPSEELQPEADSAAAAATPPVSTATEAQRKMSGRQSKRSRDSVELADSNTVGGARKRRKGKKSQAGS